MSTGQSKLNNKLAGTTNFTGNDIKLHGILISCFRVVEESLDAQRNYERSNAILFSAQSVSSCFFCIMRNASHSPNRCLSAVFAYNDLIASTIFISLSADNILLQTSTVLDVTSSCRGIGGTKLLIRTAELHSLDLVPKNLPISGLFV